jgi:hypothetical protein
MSIHYQDLRQLSYQANLHQVQQIDEQQTERREHNQRVLADVETIKLEGANLQGNHVSNVNKRMRLLAENNRENKDFVGKFGNLTSEQHNLRLQLSQIDHLVSQYQHHLSQSTACTERAS